MLSSEKRLFGGLKVEVTSKEVKRLKVSLSGKKKKSAVEGKQRERRKKKNPDSGISVNKSFCFL